MESFTLTLCIVVRRKHWRVVVRENARGDGLVVDVSKAMRIQWVLTPPGYLSVSLFISVGMVASDCSTMGNNHMYFTLCQVKGKPDEYPYNRSIPAIVAGLF